MVSLAIVSKVLKPEQLLRLTKATAPVANIAHRFGPEILTGAGIVGGVGAAVLGARATLKLEGVLDQINEDLATVRNGAEITDRHGERKFDDALINKTIMQVKVRGVLDVAKLYAPAVGLGAASIACVLGAHGIMKRREVALIAAYNGLEKAFASYRARVVEEYGEDKDRDFRLGLREEKIKDEETGKTKTVVSKDPNGYSIYAKFFDQLNPRWEEQAEYNMIFLRAQQNYFNDRLHARGHVFLNEVYDALGIEHTQAGSVVGWYVHDGGDNYIDFGIYDMENDRKRMFVNGLENGILLDFNVDGMIFDKIGK